MKKLIALVMALAVSLSFAACSGGEDKADSNLVKKGSFEVGQTAVFDELKFTANEVKESTGTSFFAPEDGNIFVGVEFTIENNSEEERPISGYMCFDTRVDDVECAYSLTGVCAFDSSIDETVAPGGSKTGWYVVEAPEDWKNLEIEINPDIFLGDPITFVYSK
ncbi:MAG: DUF4352 domain-containing protein [Clostridia bacterium]|nr:DUF4352 domain-containing protein [Clostridia bacterium]